ncbi:hypothetical protein BTVI_144769 [Pitangus sulphuratus]|nr:hypothetical protein BTVI_144769 [Pitangus sulphuratus]
MAELGSKGVTAGKIASNVQKKLTRAQEKRDQSVFPEVLYYQLNMMMKLDSICPSGTDTSVILNWPQVHLIVCSRWGIREAAKSTETGERLAIQVAQAINTLVASVALLKSLFTKPSHDDDDDM